MTNIQPVKPDSDHHHTLAKWLNEESTAPIDRIALAHVLGLAPQSHTVNISNQERMDFERFCETCEDGQGYDVSSTMMRKLAEIGLVCYSSKGIYTSTLFGDSVLNAPQPVIAFEPTQHQVLAITTAYEQGVGKGQQGVNFNPYGTGHYADAWVMGYKLGQENPTNPVPATQPVIARR